MLFSPGRKSPRGRSICDKNRLPPFCMHAGPTAPSSFRFVSLSLPGRDPSDFQSCVLLFERRPRPHPVARASGGPEPAKSAWRGGVVSRGRLGLRGAGPAGLQDGLSWRRLSGRGGQPGGRRDPGCGCLGCGLQERAGRVGKCGTEVGVPTLVDCSRSQETRSVC